MSEAQAQVDIARRAGVKSKDLARLRRWLELGCAHGAMVQIAREEGVTRQAVFVSFERVRYRIRAYEKSAEIRRLRAENKRLTNLLC